MDDALRMLLCRCRTASISTALFITMFITTLGHPRHRNDILIGARVQNSNTTRGA
jgi:hypothetical protein